MKVFITKYAQTKGIIETEGKLIPTYPNMIDATISGYPIFYHKPYWHTTKEEAISEANKRVKRKIASLEKQIEKLKKLKF